MINKELKNQVKQLGNNSIKILIILSTLIVSFVCSNLYATGAYLYNSMDVSYDNTDSVVVSSDVQCAIDEAYQYAKDYNLISSLVMNNSNIRNSIFRGKDVTNYYTDGSLYDRIKGTNGYKVFEDLYVGDYITASSGGKTINWRIAGFDMYMNKGDGGDNVAPLTVHHAVIVPDTNIITAQMNPLDENNQNYTTGGYVGSQMYTTTLPTVLSTYIEPVFGTHILTYRNLLTIATTSGRICRYGTSTSVSSNWAWQTRKLDLMNENQLTGSIEWSSSGYETGSDNIQFPLFRLKPQYVQKQRSTYWLRNIMSSNHFADVSNGTSGRNLASASSGVRFYFYID